MLCHGPRCRLAKGTVTTGVPLLSAVIKQASVGVCLGSATGVNWSYCSVLLTEFWWGAGACILGASPAATPLCSAPAADSKQPASPPTDALTYGTLIATRPPQRAPYRRSHQRSPKWPRSDFVKTTQGLIETSGWNYSNSHNKPRLFRIKWENDSI